jgi:hypothetical protein
VISDVSLGSLFVWQRDSRVTLAIMILRATRKDGKRICSRSKEK